MSTTWSLELCRFCKGAGILGSSGMYSIFCESCEGTGLGWRQRCALEMKITLLA